jgi:transketolase
MGADVGVIDLFNLSRFSAPRLREELSQYRSVISMEEGFSGRGGLDAMLFDFLSNHDLDAKMLNIGVEGKYRYELGTRKELHELVGIGPDVVTQRVAEFIGIEKIALYQSTDEPVE